MLIFVWCRVDDLVEIVVVLLVIRIQHLVYPLTLYSKYDVIKKEGFHIHISLCTLNNSLYNTITSPKTGNNVSEFTRTQTGLHCLILPSPKHKESAFLIGSVTSVVTNLEYRLVGNFNREFTSTQICITQPSLLKSKAEVRAKPRDSLLYHVHLNSIKPVLPGLS